MEIETKAPQEAQDGIHNIFDSVFRTIVPTSDGRGIKTYPATQQTIAVAYVDYTGTL